MDDGAMIINPGREKGEPVLPPRGMLLVNPAEAKAGLHLAENMAAERHFLFNSRLAVVPAQPPASPFFLAGPAVGAPMAVLTLEKLVALGAQTVVVYGWCGSLHDSLRTGDVLLPTWNVSDEGTSAHYPGEQRAESHAPTRTLLAEGLTGEGLRVRAGPVWTTDAPYRESTVRVEELGRRGIMGVDMESGALAAAAAFRKIDLATVLLVSDELWSGTWKPGFRRREFRRKSGVILHFLAKFCSHPAPARQPS
ncbi:MAG: nucleoside phosphorylase [Deltaproteobacteria bacterium]|jgi:uridine phosphorylase|nr:nucleoside phosphorylase [Deltaproteobacteria bacterium]